MIKIMEKINHHYDTVAHHYGEEHIFGVFAYGSMNYGFYKTGVSDVDTKAIYVPNWNDLFYKKEISDEILMDYNSGEHSEVKDIREMFKMFKKQNMNFLEILFTDYFKINPMFEGLWNMILLIRNDIPYLYPNKAVLGMAGNGISCIKRAVKAYQYGEMDKYKKNIANAYRSLVSTSLFINKESYEDCIYITNRDARNIIWNYKFDENCLPPTSTAKAIENELHDIICEANEGRYFELQTSEKKCAEILKTLDMVAKLAIKMEEVYG